MSPADKLADQIDWNAETDLQAQIASEVAAADSPVAEDPAPEQSGVVLKPTAAVEGYPLSVSVVGSDELVFENEAATLTVSAEVAEQVKYLPSVKVAE